ncbi:MAG: acetylglutamate kinase [Actinobacteria bacterium]|jgi:acetylglutamate kinase|uniref:acetylglutamate kinase n=1 Tax=freshwater metagenome TaxID=449393 RepID=A0A6J6C3B7_9ZZZZ|nr:acetylglutamate kinase [Actinomycetota bacterium]MTA30027.1 acetylglutamate kinase [Actinomycetota bacterium]
MLKTDQQDTALARIKAETLIESLPWLKQFHGKTIVVKFGGNAMVDDALQQAFAEDMAYLRWIGIRPVVVHGGGPQITARLAELGIETEFRGGFRVTTPETISVVRDVLRLTISARLAGLIEFAGAKTQVMSGEDANLFRAEKTILDSPEGPVDIGLVGEVTLVNPRIVFDALEAGRIPVISTVAPDASGQLLNVNADLAASALAVALGAEKLMVLTDVPGLYADWPNRDSMVSEINVSELRELLPTLESGMIPKMQACLQAVEHGVPRAHIIDGRTPHSILLEIFTRSGFGTMVFPDESSEK